MKTLLIWLTSKSHAKTFLFFSAGNFPAQWLACWHHNLDCYCRHHILLFYCYVFQVFIKCVCLYILCYMKKVGRGLKNFPSFPMIKCCRCILRALVSGLCKTHQHQQQRKKKEFRPQFSPDYLSLSFFHLIKVYL